MPQQQINVGSVINAGDGEAIRNAFTKVNAMMIELYGFLSVNGIDPNFLPNGSLANAKLAAMAAGTIKGNLGGAPATPSDLSLATLRAALGAPVIGSVVEYSGILLPSGYLWADGAAVSRATYPALFTVLTLATTGNTINGSSTITSVATDITALGLVGAPIEGAGIPAGTTVVSATNNSITLSTNATATASGVPIRILPFGRGDGSSTFNLPDRRGRFAFGRDGMGGAAASRITNSGTGNPGINGTSLGASGGADRHTLTVQQMPPHDHSPESGTEFITNGVSAYGVGIAAGGLGGATTADAGGGQAHPQVPPAISQNFIIYTGV